ncbi:MAG: adenylate/guanylate cyclase domain-containing protein [Pseudomonadota bacterium]
MSVPSRITMTTLLVGAVGILVSGTVILVILLSAMANFRNTIDLVYYVSQQAMDALERDIRGHLSPAASLVRQLAVRVEAGRINPNDNEAIARFASGGFASAPQIAGLVAWDKDYNEVEVLRSGSQTLSLKVGKAHDHDFVRQISADLFQEGRSRWGAPFREQGVTVVNVLMPLKFKGEFAGMAASGVTISELSAFLKKDTQNYDVTPFILYGGDRVLAHPSLAEKGGSRGIMTKDEGLIQLSAFPDPVMSAYLTADVEEHPEEAAFSLRSLEWNGEDYLYLTREISGFSDKPWTIGVYTKTGRFDEQFGRLGFSIAAGIGLLFLSILLIWFMARRIAHPVRQISDAAERVSSLDLSDVPKLKSSRVRELDSQASAFNRMTSVLRLFETYVPRQLVRRMLRDPDAQVEPHEEVLTVMFVDVVGFTAASENMSPSEVARMLNAYFTVVNRCIDAEEGTVDKYIGDAVMAFWGAPEAQTDHAARACRAALAIAEACRTEPDFPDIRLKVAVHTGPLLVGNIGAPGRINFTVIGDTVNACARLEALCSHMDDGKGTVILISRETFEAAGEGFHAEQTGQFKVKGRKQPVEVYRLLGIH